MGDSTYRQTTDDITVEVLPIYLDRQSKPENRQYLWAYRVRIKNESPKTVQLLSRHWRITDAHGKVREVHGPGVVGEQPVLEPGGTYEYTSWTPLETDSGFMVGSYDLRDQEGNKIDLAIPAFSLDTPVERRIN